MKKQDGVRKEQREVRVLGEETVITNTSNCMKLSGGNQQDLAMEGDPL